ncbi:Uncharacterized protein OBRU01_21062 [Operophtera brumata]|uniref:Uncharacterized protein n=1 Tax=Operophtera brumata TaxID=104452 RepID=A0A0L7KU30_OPEBR|nr:Uncharacterized protein OBRU01_21062 [Operophtera brumata]
MMESLKLLGNTGKANQKNKWRILIFRHPLSLLTRSATIIERLLWNNRILLESEKLHKAHTRMEGRWGEGHARGRHELLSPRAALGSPASAHARRPSER